MRSHRSLRTILFTDIVGSTERASELGDAAWRELLQSHHVVVRRTLRHWGAREVSEAGDGFLAVLDSPARGIACAAAIRDAVRSLGLEVRCGVHMGEIENAPDGSVGGIGVHIGARVGALAATGEILVSRAVRDAVEGSGFAFEDRGAFALKGIQGDRQLFAVTVLPEQAASLAPGRGERAVSALRARPKHAAAVVLALVALGAAFIARYGETTGRDGEDPAPAAAADSAPAIDRSIAVLPFDNLSADAEDAFFAEGITDDVMAALSKLDDLRVISRTSVLQYRETTKPVRQIAQELGVGTVLEGTVRRAGDRVRITVQLIDARTDEHLWAEQYDRELTDVFAIQTEIAEAIAGRLHAELAAEERRRIEAGQTNDPEAYLLVLKARERMRSAVSGAAQLSTVDEELRVVIDLLHRATARDARYARAYADLAGAYSYLAFLKGGSWADSSRAAAQRAIELDPRLGAAHRALGYAHVGAGSVSDAMASFRRAIELDPNDVGAISILGALLSFEEGRPDEGLRLHLKGVSLEPTIAERYGNVGSTYMNLEMLDEAEAWFVREVELAPDKALGHTQLVMTRLVRGDTLGARAALDKALELGPGEVGSINAMAIFEITMENWEEARSSIERMYAEAGNWGFLPVYLAYAYERLGNPDRAEELYRAAERDALKQVEVREDILPAYILAMVHAGRGDKDAALHWLDEAYRRGWRLRWYLAWDPLFESLHDDPRFEQLLERMDADLTRMRERVRREGLARLP
jgi:TolB-like protein/class 3 adenylate cyclase/Tfp pilus assembly protein PilF